MNDPNGPGNRLEFPEAKAVMRRAQWLWRGCLLLPFLYLGLAFLVDRIWFARNYGSGFLPMRDRPYLVLIASFAILAMGSQAALLGFRKHFNALILSERLKPAATAELYWKRTLYLVSCADVVSGLGLVAFLLNADWNAPIVFCLFSYLLYAQSYPHDAQYD